MLVLLTHAYYFLDPHALLVPVECVRRIINATDSMDVVEKLTMLRPNSENMPKSTLVIWGLPTIGAYTSKLRC